MSIFNFIFNCIIGYIELLNRIPFIGSFTALDFLIGCFLLVVIFKLLKGGND